MSATTTARFSIFAVLLTLIFNGLEVDSAAIKSVAVQLNRPKHDIVYKRYRRRRPSQHSDELYVDEFWEVFNVRHRPPMYWLSDEDVDRIIRCDFDPTREECKEIQNAPVPETPSYQKPAARPKPKTTTTQTTIKPITTTVKYHISTTSSHSIFDEELPLLPEISLNDVVDETEHENEADIVIEEMEPEDDEEEDEYEEEADEDTFADEDDNLTSLD